MRRSAYSLLEVIVALAILLLGLAALSQLTGLSGTASRDSEEFAIVQLATQAKLNELLATQETIIPVSEEPILGVYNWTISVEPTDSGRPGLTALHIIAKKKDNQNRAVSRYELIRWVTNDRFVAQRSSLSPSSLPNPPFEQTPTNDLLILENPPVQEFFNPY